MPGLPYFPFYPADWLSSTKVQLMTAAERGLYIQLLAVSWQSGALPNEERDLAKLGSVTLNEFRRLWVRVQTGFVQTPAGWVNERLEVERERAARSSRKQHNAAKSRWSDHAMALPERCQSDATDKAPGNAMAMPFQISESDSESEYIRSLPSEEIAQAEKTACLADGGTTPGILPGFTGTAPGKPSAEQKPRRAKRDTFPDELGALLLTVCPSRLALGVNAGGNGPAKGMRKVTLDEWRIVGEWLAAGGWAWPLQDETACVGWDMLARHGAKLRDAAIAWDRQGRPATRSRASPMPARQEERRRPFERGPVGWDDSELEE